MRHLGIAEATELARAAHAGQTGPDGWPVHRASFAGRRCRSSRPAAISPPSWSACCTTASRKETPPGSDCVQPGPPRRSWQQYAACWNHRIAAMIAVVAPAARSRSLVAFPFSMLSCSKLTTTAVISPPADRTASATRKGCSMYGQPSGPVCPAWAARANSVASAIPRCLTEVSQANNVRHGRAGRLGSSSHAPRRMPASPFGLLAGTVRLTGHRRQMRHRCARR